MAEPQNRPGQAGFSSLALQKADEELAERVTIIESSPSGGDPTSAQVNLNWRNGNDGEYYGHDDTAVAAFGDMIMYDPRKNAPSGVVQDSVLKVTLPAITSADYGKVIKASCQYDSADTQVNTGASYRAGLAGSIRFSPTGLDLIGDTSDGIGGYGAPYTDWLAGDLAGSGSINDNKQGPYVAKLVALPPDDDASYGTGRWVASIETLNMGAKAGPVQRWTEVTDPSSPYTASAGDRITFSGTGANPTVNLPNNPSVGDEVAIFLVGTGGESCTVGRNSSNINNQASDDNIQQTAPASGLGPLGGKIYGFTGTIGWVIMAYVRPD